MEKQKVLIINTGGTLGMAPSADGFVPNKNLVNDLIAASSEFAHQELPAHDLHTCSHLIDSSNMNYQYWNNIASLIAENYEKYDGFLILHGTDTMCYTASALSFALGNLAKPVVLTGSQIPVSQFRNDAKDNMIHGLVFAAQLKVQEVCIYFGHKLLRGNRAIKYSTDGFAAFRSPKYHALADAGVKIKLHEKYLHNSPGKQLQLQLFKKSTVALLRLYPNFYNKLLDVVANDDTCQALVLAVFGKGTMPSEDAEFMRSLRAVIASGKPIIVCSQCPQAEIDLQCYQVIRELFEAGALSALDMTVEAAVAKTQFLLSKYVDDSNQLGREAFVKAFGEDLAGEVSVE